MIEIYIAEGNFTDILNSGAFPTARGSVRFSPSVLALAADETGVRRRNPSDTAQTASYSLPQTNWAGRDSVLYRIQAVAVAGPIDSTDVAIEDIVWGGAASAQSNLQMAAFENGRFRAILSQAGGSRRIAPRSTFALASAGAQIVHLSPNPAKDALEITYFLPESGLVELALLNAKGEIVQTLAQEVQASGEHRLQARIDRLPSGSYTVRLLLNGRAATRQAQIVR
jgi:hypothetical protein